MGTDVEGLTEVRAPGGRREARDWPPGSARVRDRDARECLFGCGGELVPDHVTRAPPAVLDASEELFGEDLWPYEWPPGGEVRLDGAVHRPVAYTARMSAPPDGERWAPVRASMRDPAAVRGDEDVRLIVWFG